MIRCNFSIDCTVPHSIILAYLCACTWVSFSFNNSFVATFVKRGTLILFKVKMKRYLQSVLFLYFDILLSESQKKCRAALDFIHVVLTKWWKVWVSYQNRGRAECEFSVDCGGLQVSTLRCFENLLRASQISKSVILLIFVVHGQNLRVQQFSQ